MAYSATLARIMCLLIDLFTRHFPTPSSLVNRVCMEANRRGVLRICNLITCNFSLLFFACFREICAVSIASLGVRRLVDGLANLTTSYSIPALIRQRVPHSDLFLVVPLYRHPSRERCRVLHEKSRGTFTLCTVLDNQVPSNHLKFFHDLICVYIYSL